MNLSLFDLSGKVAIVTGGYSGIGRSIADGLAEAGANIVITARNFDLCRQACAEIEKLGVRTLPFKCDVGSSTDVAELMSAVIRKFEKIDILVNNAGKTGSGKPMVDISDEEWDRTQNINLRGMFLCSKIAAKEMIKQNRGKIINVTSIASFMPIFHSADYCASKGGALLLTKVMALELIKYNINVNAICPGYVDTPFIREPAKRRAEAPEKIPIGRMAHPDEMKGLAILLASSASDYMVGSAILIDGGQTLK